MSPNYHMGLFINGEIKFKRQHNCLFLAQCISSSSFRQEFSCLFHNLDTSCYSGHIPSSFGLGILITYLNLEWNNLG